MEENKETQGALQGVGEKPLDKKQQSYVNGLMKMLHSKQSAPDIEEILKTTPPEVGIPEAALLVNRQMEEAIKQRGTKPDLETVLTGGIYLVSDLIEIGNAGGFFQIGEQDEEMVKDIMQSTFQKYIEKGLKDGSIDPIELQSQVEPLLNEQQKAFGAQSAGELGVPMQADESTAMSEYGAQQKRAGILEGQAQAKPQQPQQGGA